MLDFSPSAAEKNINLKGDAKDEKSFVFEFNPSPADKNPQESAKDDKSFVFDLASL